jgi:hypothetical protein
MHVSEAQSTTSFRFEQLLLGFPVNFMIALLAAPPKLANSTFHLMTDTLRDEEAAHHVSRDGLYDCTDKNTPTSKGQVSLLPAL